MPLEFVGSQALRWGGPGGEMENITGTYVTEGTLPSGSTWAMDPIPCDMGCPGCPGWTFEPRCKETPNCANWMNGSRSDTNTNHCRCTGGTTYNMEIVDYVMIPEHLPSGEYVLGKREHGSSRRCALRTDRCSVLRKRIDHDGRRVCSTVALRRLEMGLRGEQSGLGLVLGRDHQGEGRVREMDGSVVKWSQMALFCPANCRSRTCVCCLVQPGPSVLPALVPLVIQVVRVLES